LFCNSETGSRPIGVQSEGCTRGIAVRGAGRAASRPTQCEMGVNINEINDLDDAIGRSPDCCGWRIRATQKGKCKGPEKEKETVAAQGKDGSAAAASVSITKADRELITDGFTVTLQGFRRASRSVSSCRRVSRSSW